MTNSQGTEQNGSEPLAYTIRVSQRARNVSIHVSHQGMVEVVIPKGFDAKRVPEIVERRQNWVISTQQKLAASRQAVMPETTDQLPQQIQLRSLLEDWTVSYRPTADTRIVASHVGKHRLQLHGATHSIETCQAVLQRWLSRKARTHFEPWLHQVSEEISLPFSTVSVRHQKTLWASCSSKQSISLNAKLLFLPPSLVRYVFIHELCHTIHMNHSANFWALVAEKEPNYQEIDRELSKAWRYVPSWAEQVRPLSP